MKIKATNIIKKLSALLAVCMTMSAIGCGNNNNQTIPSIVTNNNNAESSDAEDDAMSEDEIMKYYADYLRTCEPIVRYYKNNYCGLVIRFTNVTDTGCTVEWDSFGNNNVHYSVANYRINDTYYGSAECTYSLVPDDDNYLKPCIIFDNLTYTYALTGKDTLTNGFLRLSDWYGDFQFHGTTNPGASTSGQTDFYSGEPNLDWDTGFYWASEENNQ